MSEQEQPQALVVQIAKLRLEPGDTLVVKLDCPDPARFRYIAERHESYLRSVLGAEVKVLILGPGAELSVLQQKE